MREKKALFLPEEIYKRERRERLNSLKVVYQKRSARG
jgi:hypothetical protein